MSANRQLWVYLLLAISLISLITPVSGIPDSLTHGDDEDWANAEFSGSGDGLSHDDDAGRSSEVRGDGSDERGKVIDLNIPGDHQIQDRPTGRHSVKLTSDTIQVKSVNSISVTDTQESDQHKSSAKKRKPESPSKDRKTKKADKKHKKKKKKKLFKKAKKNGKTMNLAQSKASVKLKGNESLGDKVKNSKDESDYHIQKNNYENGRGDQLRRRHPNRHHKKRWRKNMDSNRHGYGSKGNSRKRKKTFEDRWPGCFSKYQSCYRNSNCCNNNCHQFTWLSFGFCL